MSLLIRGIAISFYHQHFMANKAAAHSWKHLLAKLVFASYLNLSLQIKLGSMRSWQSYDTNTDNTIEKGGDFIMLKDYAKHDLTALCIKDLLDFFKQI